MNARHKSQGMKVEYGLPIPPVKKYPLEHSGRPIKWPINELLVGQSLFIPRKLIKNINSIRASAHYWSKQLNRKHRCRDTGDGIRIWRVA